MTFKRSKAVEILWYAYHNEKIVATMKEPQFGNAEDLIMFDKVMTIPVTEAVIKGYKKIKKDLLKKKASDEFEISVKEE